MKCIPISENVGLEIVGLNPIRLTDGIERSLSDWFAYAGILLMRGLDISPGEQLRFSKVFGDKEVHPIEDYLDKNEQGLAVLTDLGTKEEAGDTIIGRINWHADLTYLQKPSRGALLYAVEVPASGGETAFVDRSRVFHALPNDRKAQLSRLQVVHSFERGLESTREEFNYGLDYDRLPKLPDVTHPLVYRHPNPLSKSYVINLSPIFEKQIVNMSTEASDQLLGELTEFATQEQFVYIHSWTPGDLIIWDNWQVMHSALGHKKKYTRTMNRTGLAGRERLSDYYS